MHLHILKFHNLFVASVCDKFLKPEFTGDILLELNIALKSETGIVAYGKRIRIAIAIVESSPTKHPVFGELEQLTCLTEVPSLNRNPPLQDNSYGAAA